jgi:hypothetical protein
VEAESLEGILNAVTDEPCIARTIARDIQDQFPQVLPSTR